MKYIFTTIFIAAATILNAQQSMPIVLNDVVIHVGNGTVIEHGTIVVKNGKLDYVGELNESFNAGANVIADVKGKHVYPGLIALNSQTGLKEIELSRATIDVAEVGEFNPNVRSLVAYNTDSRVIPTLRSNGVLLSQPTPVGGIIPGQSSVMKMAGWNWEDAVVSSDIAMHINWPAIYSYDNIKKRVAVSASYVNEVNKIRQFFAEAKAYCSTQAHTVKNLRFEAMRNLLAGKQKLFVNADYAKQLISAIDLSKEFDLQIVLVSGSQLFHVMDMLKENQIPVVLKSTFLLPSMEGEDVDMPYKLPSLLQNNGILFGISVSNDGSGYWNARNLPFAAGKAVAHGLTKEQALASITFNNAKILGIDNNYGTLEKGKSATLFVSEGDVLDMQTSKLIYILINGESFPVANWQSELYEQYSVKYGLEVK